MADTANLNDIWIIISFELFLFSGTGKNSLCNLFRDIKERQNGQNYFSARQQNSGPTSRK